MAEERVLKFTIESDDVSIENTRKKIEQLKSAMLSATDVDTFNALALEAGNLETEIRRVEDAVTSLAGSGSELTKMSNSFARVGASIASMDFGAAAEEAGRLAAISKSMSFGSAITSLKQLGSTFLSLGKALLTNPFFLLAGVLTAIVVAIYKLLDSLGIIEDIFTAVGDAIDWVIQKMKDFLDWLGLTSYAADEEAAAEAKRQEDIKAAREAAFNQYVKEKELEIAQMKASGASIQEIEDAEINLAQTRLDAAKARLKQEEAAQQAIINQLKAWGQLANATKLQIELDNQRNEVKQLEIGLIETQSRVEDARAKRGEDAAKRQEERAKKLADDRKKIADAQMKAEQLIQEQQIGFIQDEIERAEQLALFKERQAFNNIDKTLLTQQQIEILEQQHLTRMALIRDDANEKRKEREAKEREESVKAEEETAKKKADQQKALVEELARIGREEIEREAMVQDAKRQLIDNALGAIGANLKEGSKAQKAVAVAQTSIETYRGAQAAFTATAANPITSVFPAAPFIAAASAVAFGLANVRRILATDPVNGTPSGGGGGAGQAPVFGTPTQANTTPTMNINEGVEQNAGGSVERGKVMVVDYTDIENKGKEVGMLKNRVSLI